MAGGSGLVHRKDKPSFHSTLFLCLLSSMGVCVAFLPVIPVNVGSSTQRGTTMAVAMIFTTAVMAVIDFQLIRLIWNKHRFHQAQTVLWPMRCLHCARVMGILKPSTRVMGILQPSGPGGDGGCNPAEPTAQGCVDDGATLTANASLPAGHVDVENETSHFLRGENELDYRYLSTSPSSPTNRVSRLCRLSPSYQVSSSGVGLSDPQYNNPSSPRYLYTRRHRSLVNMFNIFCILAFLTLPVIAASKVVCIVYKTYGVYNMPYLAAGELFNLALISTIPIAMIFLLTYYDAVFVSDIQNSYSIVIFLAGGIWLSASLLVDPLYVLLGYRQTEEPCLNGTFGVVMDTYKRALDPFYTECAIIASGILWQMWTSFVSRSELVLDQEMPRFEPFPEAVRFSCTRALIAYCRRCLRRRCVSGHNEEEQQTLLPPDPIIRLQQHLIKTWVLSFIAGFTFFIACLYMVIDPSQVSNTNPFVCLLYCIQMAIMFPYIVFFIHINYVSRHTTDPVEGQSHPCEPPRHMEGHNVLLLLCACGLFCQSFLRITSSLGLLIETGFEVGEDLVLCIFGFFYSICTIGFIFSLTSFLLRIQYQKSMSYWECKWVLSCLIYIAVTSTASWLVDNIVIQTWPIQARYFGATTAKVVGVLMDPFEMLYGLHSAMVAYEAYKDILVKVLDRPSSRSNHGTSQRE